jgi:hypothetical protein
MDKSQLSTCACCGDMTIYDEHEICDVCTWQCDFAQESRPDWRTGANGRTTLREAQQNFIKTGDCDGRPNERHESPSLYERDPTWRPFPVQPEPVEDAKAWRRPREQVGNDERYGRLYPDSKKN